MTRPKLVFSARRQDEPSREIDDRELLEAIGEDDEEALDLLVQRKTEPLLQTVYRMLGDLEEARDVVQVAFVRLWENRRRYDPRWSPNTWIYRIATNLAIDQLRARRTRERSTEPVRWHLRQVAGSGTGRGFADLQQREVHEIFQRLAAGLSEKQRAVFLLREVEGLSSREVAEVVGCRESTVRNHLFNARRQLRRQLARQYPEYAELASGEGVEA
jgi:RNA polymerase sigma-70 factor (ECF subfamily)